MKKLLLLLITCISFTACNEPKKYDLIIKNVNVFNGYQELGLVNIAINSDTVAAITTEEIIGDSIIDSSGKYIIPGLVNAHVHASSLDQLKQGYPMGIMYLLNMHTGLEEREKKWKEMSLDSTGYSILHGSGHAATVPDGHPTQFSPDMETINDSISIQAWVDNRIARGADYIKVISRSSDLGWMGESPPPSLTYDQIAQIIKYAHSKEKKVIIHVGTVEQIMNLLPLDPDGFAHMIISKNDFPPSDEFYNKLAESGAFVIPTAGINLKSMEGMPTPMLEWITNNLMSAEESAEVIQKIHENGVMIVAGTDAQVGQMNFGVDYFLEIELYKMAGLTNLEILKTATGNAAKAFGLPVGELSVGGKANFIILKDNPTEDIAHLESVSQVWKNGKAN